MPYHKVLIGATQPLTFLLNTVRDFSQVPGPFYCTVQKYTGLEIDRGQSRRYPGGDEHFPAFYRAEPCFSQLVASPNAWWFLEVGRGALPNWGRGLRVLPPESESVIRNKYT